MDIAYRARNRFFFVKYSIEEFIIAAELYS